MFRWGWVNVDAFWKSFYGRSKFKKSFKYILLNNNSHESVGGQETNLASIDLKKIVKQLNFDKYY